MISLAFRLHSGIIAHNAWREPNNYWATGAPWWKQEQKHLSLATQRLRGPEALLVRSPSYISRCCCVTETQRWNPCDFHVSGPQVWPDVLGAAHRSKRVWHRCSVRGGDSLKVRSMDRALSNRTAPGCLPTEGKQTAEVEFALIKDEEVILWAITLLRYCLNHMTRETSHDGVWRFFFFFFFFKQATGKLWE